MSDFSTSTNRHRLKEVALVFFKLGCFAFGGPAAHIAMMEEEIVKKRKWMTMEHYLDLIGATNLIPSPNSTEMTMHCGHERAGRAGLFVAGICFITPAVLVTGVLAYFYSIYHTLPQVEPFIQGIKPVILIVILGAVLKLGKKALKNKYLYGLGVLVLTLALYGHNEIILLLGAGFLGTLFFSGINTVFKNKLSSFWGFIPLISIGTKTLSASSIFFTFLKVGTILYGSGYVLFAYLDAELVAQGLMTRLALIDAIAVGQFTPGPVLSTSTFIGYQLGGLSGACAATAGIFLPSFLFTLILNPLVPKMRKHKAIGYFLDSVNVAAVAVMMAVLIEMGRETLIDWRALVILGLAALATFGPKKFNIIPLIIAGAVLGYLLRLI